MFGRGAPRRGGDSWFEIIAEIRGAPTKVPASRSRRQRHVGNYEPGEPGLFDDGRPAGEALEVPIDLLDDDPSHPRTEDPEAALVELAQDIAERGVLQPIVVAPGDVRGRYRICFGGQRWRAARLAGRVTVPVLLRSQSCNGYDQVAENLKRCALSPLDLARFIKSRTEAGESNAFIAKPLAIDATTVAYHLSLLQLSPELSPELTAAMSSGRCPSPRTASAHARDRACCLGGTRAGWGLVESPRTPTCQWRPGAWWRFS